MMHTVNFMLDCRCGFSRADLHPFVDAGYFSHPVALIDLQSEIVGVARENTRRQIARATRAGYVVKEFHPRSYLTDLVEVNTSKRVRSGGRMREHYLQSVDDAGGQPAKRGLPPPPLCKRHHTVSLGVFTPDGGYWGDGKLVAYVYVNVFGEFANYSSILGHGDYLNMGVMQFLHARTIDYLRGNGFSRYVVYYRYDNPPGLIEWKRRAGFVESMIEVAT